MASPVAGGAAEEAARLISQFTGRPLDPARQPLEAAALLVPDDLVVLVRKEGRWCMGAGVVCFPSHWSPPSKLGLPVAEIHGPVPGYEVELRDRVDRFLDHLVPANPVWRRNWTIHASAELHAPRPVTTVARAAPGDHWLRSERQVLAALPESAGVLFTIRTEQVEIGLLREGRAFALMLAQALRATPPELAEYRFGSIDIDRIASWLEGEG